MSVEVQPDLNVMWEAAALPPTDPAYVDPALLVLADNKPSHVYKALATAELEVNFADNEIRGAKDEYARAQENERWFDAFEADAARKLRALGGKDMPLERSVEESGRVADARERIGVAVAAREDLNEQAARTRAVNGHRDKVAKAATVLACAPGVLIGSGVVVTAVEVFAAIEDSASAQYDATHPKPTPSPTPSVRPSLPPDTEGVHYEQGLNGTMIVTTTVTEGQSAAAVNPLAKTCAPTGQEAPADKVAAQKALAAVTELGGDVEITATEIKGVADDTSGSGPDAGLGVPDKPGTGNDCRGNMRKDIGVQVMTTEAAAAGVNLGKVTATGGEHVLQPGEIANVDRIAGQLGISRTQLIAAYNIDRTGLAVRVNAEDLKSLDGYFFRGVEYKLTVSRKVQETRPDPHPKNPVTSTAKEMKENHIGPVTFEAALAGLMGFLGGAVGLFGANKMQGQLARLAARRQVARIRAEKQTTGE